jgi:hypothetical protein
MAIRIYIIPLLAFVLLVAGCNKENGNIPTSGEATLSSKLYFNEETQNYYTKGFSFSKGKVVNYERFVSQADLVAQPLWNTNIVGAYLESPDNDNAFKLKGEFDNAQDAANFFDELKLVNDNVFTVWANPLNENEVYVVQTGDLKYAKIWIKKIELFNGPDEGYVEVTFQWQYQPDGTRVFE